MPQKDALLIPMMFNWLGVIAITYNKVGYTIWTFTEGVPAVMVGILMLIWSTLWIISTYRRISCVPIIKNVVFYIFLLLHISIILAIPVLKHLECASDVIRRYVFYDLALLVFVGYAFYKYEYWRFCEREKSG